MTAGFDLSPRPSSHNRVVRLPTAPSNDSGTQNDLEQIAIMFGRLLAIRDHLGEVSASAYVDARKRLAEQNR